MSATLSDGRISKYSIQFVSNNLQFEEWKLKLELKVNFVTKENINCPHSIGIIISVTSMARYYKPGVKSFLIEL